jgi:lambda family phage tail tape measure protein
MAMNMEAMLKIRANVVGENNIRRLGNSMQGVQGQVKNLAMSFDSLRAAVGGVAGLIGGGLIINKIFGDAATLESQARSLQVLTGSATQASQIIRELQSYGALTPFESTELIETAKRLNAFGVESNRVVDVVKTLGDVAGATGANLGELATAYGQVVAKGRLQGEELLQFQERGVALSAELQKMYKLQGQEFTKALEGGRISAQAVEVAIQRLTAAGGKYADGAIAQSDTLNGKFSTLKDNITGLSQTIGTVLGPAVKRILDLAINVIDTINKAIKLAISGPQQAEATASIRAGQLPFGGPAAIDRIIGEQRRRALQRQAGSAFLGVGFNEQNFIKLLQQQPEFSARGQRRAALPATPPLLPGRASGSDAAEKEKAAQKRAEAERKRIAEGIASSRESLAQSRAELAILRETDPLRKIQLEYAERRRAVSAAADKELRQQLPIEQQANIQRTRSNEIQKLQVQQTNALIEKFKELKGAGFEAAMSGELFYTSVTKTTSAMEDFRAGLGSYIESIGTLGANLSNVTQTAFKGLEDAIVSLTTTGTFNFQQFAQSIIEETTRMVTRMLIIAPVLRSLQSLFPGGGGGGLLGVASSLSKTVGFGVNAMGNVFAQNGIQKFARGGIVDKPTMFPFAKGIGLMGEAGPEAIMPLRRGRDGRLGVQATNGGGGVSVVVNVDAGGSNVQGNNNQAGQLGKAVGAAVQAELIKQRRPGGLLA